LLQNIEHIKELNIYDLELKEAKKTIEGLKPEPEVKKPKWLIGHASYKPKRRVVSKDYDKYVTIPKLQYSFDKNPYMKDLLKRKGMIGKKSLQDVKKYHKYFISQWSYAYDKVDNWRPVIDTLLVKQVDCEDGGITLSSGLGIIGFKPDEVGVCLGWYYPKGKDKDPNSKFYHAWAVVKVNGRWYILESTNPKAVTRQWTGHWRQVYQAQEFFNWKFDGKLGKTYLE